MPAAPVPVYILAGQSNAANNAVAAGVVSAIAERGGLLVQQAVGGSALSPRADFGRGDWSASGTPGSGEVYRALLAQLEATITPGSPIHVPGAYLAGVIWVQGEADGMNVNAAPDYLANLTALHADLTRRFGAHDFVVSALSSQAGPAQEDNRHHLTWASVQAAQDRFDQTVARTTLVNPDELAQSLGYTAGTMFKPDGVHYSWAFGQALGRALGQAFGSTAAQATPQAQITHHIGGFAADSFAIAGAGLHQVHGAGDIDSLSFAGRGLGVWLAGSGPDVLRAIGRGDSLMVDITGVEALTLTGHDDLVQLADRAYRIAAGGGHDRVSGSTGADQILGGTGNDTIWGGDGRDGVMGDAGADWLHGGLGADSLYGGAGDDTLLGGAGADLLHGGMGNDVLTGNAGADRLTGGWGADRFVFAPGSGTDSVTDFQNGHDRIDLAAYGTRFANLTITAQTGGTLIRFGNDGVLLQGITPGQIDAGDFLF